MTLPVAFARPFMYEECGGRKHSSMNRDVLERPASGKGAHIQKIEGHEVCAGAAGVSEKGRCFVRHDREFVDNLSRLVTGVANLSTPLLVRTEVRLTSVGIKPPHGELLSCTILAAQFGQQG